MEFDVDDLQEGLAKDLSGRHQGQRDTAGLGAVLAGHPPPTFAPPALGDSIAPARTLAPDGTSPYSTVNDAMREQARQNHSSPPDLGAEGNLIRWYLHPGFTRDMFENYWLGKGDVTLSPERFKDIADYASTLGLPKHGNVMGQNGQPLEWRQYNLYRSPDYTRSLGTSTLFYDKSGKPVGFYDNYNFDPGSPGKDRSLVREMETRVMHALPKPASAKPFKITYGNFVPPKGVP